MFTPEFSFELPELGITSEDKWRIGYSRWLSPWLLVIMKNGEMRKNKVMDSSKNGVTYDADINSELNIGGTKRLAFKWYQIIALNKGNEDDKRKAELEIVNLFENGEKV